MRIRPGDFVLEIGSGDNPHPRADILCDRFIEEDAERGGAIVADRPLIEADAMALPFADGTFDYVICSHVLEHVEDPERMLRELMRVASRGYIETPSEIGERLYGWSFHKSVIHLVDGRLVIRKKSFEPQFGALFHLLVDRDRNFARFHLTHGGLFLVRYEWDGRIDYEIAPEHSMPLDLRDTKTVEALWEGTRGASGLKRWVSILKSMVPKPAARWAKSLLSRTQRGPRRDLREFVICPACRGRVTWDADRIRCVACNAIYPIVGRIPRLIFPGLV